MNLDRGGAHTPETLRVLVVHNRYQQLGGEDIVFANEVALLREGGCHVDVLEVSNDTISGFTAQVKTALRVVSNPEGQRLVADAIARALPDIVHVHNFLPRLSPAVFEACSMAGVPVVWTLHNYRVGCANGLLFRDGHVCEDCIGRVPWPAVRYSCYRGSTMGSAAVATMIGWHRARGTWRRKVARFIALSHFSLGLFVRAGVPAERLAVKPNFVADPLPMIGKAPLERNGAVFVGRLSVEKGVAMMIAAWRNLPGIPLTVIGDGPEREAMEAAAPAWIRFIGFQDRPVVLAEMARAQVLVVPSIWYEPFGLVAAEAMALGTPIIAANIGALSTIVTNGIDGLHFTPGDTVDLVRVARAAFADTIELRRLGQNARKTWASTMSPERNLQQLLTIYREARAV